MTTARALTGLTATVLLLQPLSVFAADSLKSGCLTQAYDAIAHEERVYRSVLFGQKKSADLPEGSVRFDTEFDTWMKTGTNAWQSPENESLTWSDTLMDMQADAPARRGLFEIRKTPTSDLLPLLTQSLRALQCRMRSVCDVMHASVNAKPDAPITVKPDGCIAFTYTPFPACAQGPTLAEVQAGACDSAVITTMEREARLLRLAVAYDSAYRSLLQFSGNFEGFMNDFRFPLLQPLWQTARMLGAFDNLPCFLSQCDE